jgi:putative holliday junction resolvase
MGIILALDIGEKRIGAAVSDEKQIIALPHTVFNTADMDKCFTPISRLCTRKKVSRIIIGNPLKMDGSRGIAAKKIQAIAEKIHRCLKIPVELWDERLTTQLAEKSLIRNDVSRRKRKKVIDKLAAQAILQSYLDANNSLLNQ